MRFVMVELAPAALLNGLALYPDADALLAPMTRLPLPEGSVDSIWCFGALHHSPGGESDLPALMRYLRPGGLLALHEPVTEPGLSWLRRLWRRVFPQTHRNLDLVKLRTLIEEWAEPLLYETEHTGPLFLFERLLRLKGTTAGRRLARLLPRPFRTAEVTALLRKPSWLSAALPVKVWPSTTACQR